MGSLLPRQKRLAIVFNLGNALIRKIWKTDLQLLTQRRMLQCIRIISLWKENLEGSVMHSIGINEKIIFLCINISICFPSERFSLDFFWFLCVYSQFVRFWSWTFVFVSYRYDIALIVCATHLLFFDFLHLLGVSKST